MEDIRKYEDIIAKCQILLSKNDKIPSSSDVLNPTRKGSVYSDECIRDDKRKVILYNIRYDSKGELRSDIEVLDEIIQLETFENQLGIYKEMLTKELDELNYPGTFERLGRTLTSWVWSDIPRKERVVRRKHIQRAIKGIDNLLDEIVFQIPLYKSVASVTTTTEIQVKAKKLKDKYSKKIKKNKNGKH